MRLCLTTSRLLHQMAHFFLSYLSYRYIAKAKMLETEPNTPIASIMHKVICTTSHGKPSREGLTFASFPHLAGGWGRPPFHPKAEEWISTFVIITGKPVTVKVIWLRQMHCFDHCFDHVEQQNGPNS